MYYWKQKVDIRLEKPEEGEATGCRLCGCMLNTQVTHLWQPQAADQEQEINFVWPKIVPDRRCPLVRRPDKGSFVLLYITSNHAHKHASPSIRVYQCNKRDMQNIRDQYFQIFSAPLHSILSGPTFTHE